MLTVGTFLGGRIHDWHTEKAGGRAGDPPANRLADAPARTAVTGRARLKTGTPPRLDGTTLDYSQVMQEQPGDDPTAGVFISRAGAAEHPQQISCHITQHHCEATHDIIRGFARQTRQCTPVRSRASGRVIARRLKTRSYALRTRTSHQIFVEPEGL